MLLKALAFWILLSAALSFVFLYKISPLTKETIAVQSQNLLTSVNTEPQFTPESPSLDQIFSQDHSWTSTVPSDRKRVLIATGDVLLARTVNYKTVTSRNFIWPFEKTADILKSADITFINLETPLIEDCPLTTEGMKFCGDPRSIEGLLFAGIDIVNIANNHSGNYGLVGVNSTIETLNNAGLIPTGIAGPVYKDVNGIKFAFLGYNEVNYQDGISLASQDKIATEVSQAKSNADIVIVQFHWGNEYTTKITTNQRSLAHLAIDFGADLIIGNHPHWIQPIEFYSGKLITYSHGNFVFDQEWSLKTKQGIIGRYTFYDTKLVDAEFLPVQIEKYGQPYFLDYTRGRQILDEIKSKSLL